jgi:hypothetical protein
MLIISTSEINISQVEYKNELSAYAFSYKQRKAYFDILAMFLLHLLKFL